ncbi:hypothetical protein DPMN_152487 [Dreissena polymorpha]|uniref:Uncharacterized protein n=1 Tax=Dreissena polymorpha TaxID=45954 RepID=A0A9D4FJM3_DREPO|nr:hypothetical protein DPMN_152487 [Dreissena polymorpha]
MHTVKIPFKCSLSSRVSVHVQITSVYNIGEYDNEVSLRSDMKLLISESRCLKIFALVEYAAQYPFTKCIWVIIPSISTRMSICEFLIRSSASFHGRDVVRTVHLSFGNPAIEGSARLLPSGATHSSRPSRTTRHTSVSIIWSRSLYISSRFSSEYNVSISCFFTIFITSFVPLDSLNAM